jgi:hypothetical protein
MHPLSLSCQKQQIENETEGSHVVRRRELGREEMTARHGSRDGDSQGGERTRDLKTMYNQDNIIYAMQIMDRRPLYGNLFFLYYKIADYIILTMHEEHLGLVIKKHTMQHKISAAGPGRQEDTRRHRGLIRADLHHPSTLQWRLQPPVQGNLQKKRSEKPKEAEMKWGEMQKRIKVPR